MNPSNQDAVYPAVGMSRNAASDRAVTRLSHPRFQRAFAGRGGKLLQGASLPLVVLALWQVASSLGWAPETLLPSPVNIVRALADLVSTGELVHDIEISLLRALFGFLLGGTLGFAFGMAAGLSKHFEGFTDPTIQMVRTIPHLAITPLFILWFGLGEWSKVLLIALGAFFPLYVNTFTGIRNVDAKLFEVARILEFNRLHLVTRLMLPAALPNILLGLRLSLGVSWLGLVVAELMGSSAGVGYLIENASQFSQTSVVFVGLLIFAAVGKLSDSLVRWLERRLLRWRDSYGG
ncbi:ABC transporter permease [Alicyclobacillus macrosporangiidus]|jgi:sulfonate transport system permease protein|uniref:Sulfonate transport system permease protein n=1 Tax=Alicyclobacillus macrosporangiidus TaxID=392015 RepID=A0A1I7JQB8_9BACL|nr:ABC transporter permease [Alicyclobacillus macrosporangiidus]SFU87338.1 sulfonate transport system permease protein [Alicyclobacillus macrosporangiidus]